MPQGRLTDFWHLDPLIVQNTLEYIEIDNRGAKFRFRIFNFDAKSYFKESVPFMMCLSYRDFTVYAHNFFINDAWSIFLYIFDIFRKNWAAAFQTLS